MIQFIRFASIYHVRGFASVFDIVLSTRINAETMTTQQHPDLDFHS